MKVFLPLVLLATGCSSVSVLQERENASLAPTARPVVFYVRPFEVRRGAEFDAASAKANEDVPAKVGSLVADGIMSKAGEWVAPGRLLESDAATPSEGLLVRGKSSGCGKAAVLCAWRSGSVPDAPVWKRRCAFLISRPRPLSHGCLSRPPAGATWNPAWPVPSCPRH